jgi:hypothetical protein
MFLINVEVSGVRKVVLDHKFVWEKIEDMDVWFRENSDNVMSHDAIIQMIRAFTIRPEAHVWVSGDTINIVTDINE